MNASTVGKVCEARALIDAIDLTDRDVWIKRLARAATPRALARLLGTLRRMKP